MDLGIAGKVALVTASSKGLGFASASALAAEGCKVVICSRTEADIAAAAERIGGDVLALTADVTDPAAPASLVAQTVERFGGLDILVANAGGPPVGHALEVSDDQLAAALNENLLTSVRLVRQSVPHMQAKGWGRIALITSFFVKQPVPTMALSQTARTGLWAWAKTAAPDLFADGITINALCPGAHATDRMKQLGGSGLMGDPADFGRVVAFLCSQPAGFTTGAALQVDGGAVRSLL